MTGISRRRLVRGAGLAVGLAAAGCLRGSDGGDGDGNGDGNGDGGGGGSVTLNGTQTLQLGPLPAKPGWADDEEATGIAALYDDPERAKAALPLDRYDDSRREEIEAFVDGADHPAAQCLLVESVGPDTCYTNVTVSELAYGSEGLTGRAVATSEATDEQACGEAITYPGAAVLVFYTGEPEIAGEITVVDGWGEEGTVSLAGADDN